MDLARKYGTTKSDVGNHGRKYGWVQKRKAHRDDISTKVVRNSAEAVSEKQIKLATGIYDTALILLDKLKADIERKDSFKSVEYKNFSGSLTDLYKLLPETQREDEEQQSGGLCFMPERDRERG